MTTVELASALWLLVAALGLGLSVQYAGLPVLGQSAFVAVGGVGTALLGPGGARWPLGLAAAASVIAAGVLGQLVARAARRLEGASLALATWALAWLAYRAMLAFPGVFGGAQGLVRRAPAHLVSPSLGLDVTLTPTVHLVLAGTCCVLLVLALLRLDRGPAGLDLAALREGPELAASLGVPVAARRASVLTATAALGALSGAGTVVLLGLVAPADVSPLLSLQLFVAVLLGGAARWWGPVLGVALLTALPHLAGALPVDAGRGRGVLTAVFLVLVLVGRRVLGGDRRPAPVAVPAGGPAPGSPSPGPTGAGLAAAGLAAAGAAPAGLAAVGPGPAGLAPGSGGAPSPGPVVLAARGVVVSYGSLRALDGVDIALRAGQVHAVIGPNGSGKSTLLRVLAGALPPRAGSVDGLGRPAAPGSPARVRQGVASTPQRTVQLPRTTPRRQVALGARAGARPHAVLRQLVATPSSRIAARQSAATVQLALGRTRLAEVADLDPAELAVGQQRLLQVARALATGARVLLLDEPAAGMTSGERSTLREVLRELAADGLAVLLVEHDMRLVNAVADRVTVLDAGRVIASGLPEEIRADPAVQEAYLGTPARGPAARVASEAPAG